MIYGYFYRLLMRLSHHYNWHYMKVLGPFPDGRRQAWCQWCGVRDTIYDKSRALMEIRAADIMDQAQGEKS